MAVAPGKYDYSDLDARIERVLKAAPNAWLLPRVYTVAPEWWCARNEDEVTRYGAPREHPRPGIDVYPGRFNPSLASRAWRNFASDNMTRLIEHIQQKPWADHFLGFHFASGTSEEWVDWGTHDGYFPDYSPPMIRAAPRVSISPAGWVREKKSGMRSRPMLPVRMKKDPPTRSSQLTMSRIRVIHGLPGDRI